jgi:hypothetical protein
LGVSRSIGGRRVDGSGKLLMDALRRVIDVANVLGCVGVVVDAKDEDAERFYTKYDFVAVIADAQPRRMFLPITTAREAFLDE